MHRRTALYLLTGVTVWVTGIVAGFCVLQQYSLDEGPASSPAPDASAYLTQFRERDRALLVMAVHPNCPCTRASLSELGDLLARSQDSCDALLLQYQPANSDSSWAPDDLPRRLGGVSVRVVRDKGGEIAAALGARTSGHLVFVDGHGEIRFQGGLTLARDHRGRSPGQDAILDVLAGGRPSIVSAPVYGCTLGPECGAEAVE